MAYSHTHTASILTLASILLLTAPVSAQAQTVQTIQTAPILTSVPNETSITAKFAPRPSTTARIDFDIWDAALKEFVLYTGPSLRKRERRPQAVVGTRFVHGHTSPFRMEGNKVVYELMNDEFKHTLNEYINDLVAVGSRADIPSLPRNEQLAYWLNLHNALVVKTIMSDYPVSNPSKIRGEDGLDFHDTKLVTIDGLELSLRDIREQIVYRHWKDPRVIYGFFKGDLGSPSIQRKAFTGRNVFSVLAFSADEFVNSLRGMERRDQTLSISRLYKDVAPYYFPDFEADIRRHLRAYAGPDARKDLAIATKPIKIAKYETVTADLTAGDGDRKPFSQVDTINTNSWGTGNSTIDLALREHRVKRNTLRERGLGGVVVIEDIETDPEQGAPPPEVE